MSRKKKRNRIDEALKILVVPFLRLKGFKGSMPHFRRQQSDRINLLTFQHSRYDSKFVVEIANSPSEGIVNDGELEIPPNKVTAHDMSKRLRLGAKGNNNDYWFDYGKTGLFYNVYDKRAKEVIKLWEEAEKWWRDDEQENMKERIQHTNKRI